MSQKRGKSGLFFCAVIAATTGLEGLANGSERSSCPGNLQDHNMGLYHFETTSWVVPHEDHNLHFDRLSCIQNDQDRGLAYWWRLPGMKGRIPPKMAVDLALQIQTDITVPVETCLLYGGAGDTVKAWLRVEHKQGANSPAGASADCAKEFVQASSAIMPVQNVHAEIVNYWPSFNGDPDKTLLEFHGDVGLAVRDNIVTSYVSYRMFPYPGSYGKAIDVTFTPAFAGEAEAIMPAYKEHYDSVIRGAPEGRIEFSLGEITNGRLIYTAYEVHDSKGDIVGAIPIPVFLRPR